MSVKKNLDYIIVLGAHVDGTRMTLALLERARRALLYLEENPGTKAVLSGGKGDGENISEAEAMYRYLTGHGIDGDRLIREEESTSTKENLEFSCRKIGTTDCSVGVVTNNFHVWRGAAIARKCGFREVAMVPSRYRSWRLFIYIPREILAIIKDNSWEICRSVREEKSQKFCQHALTNKNTALIMNHRKRNKKHVDETSKL